MHDHSISRSPSDHWSPSDDSLVQVELCEGFVKVENLPHVLSLKWNSKGVMDGKSSDNDNGVEWSEGNSNWISAADDVNRLVDSRGKVMRID